MTGAVVRDAIARMTDANANRAAEGLRVIEDVARFALRDASLSARAKACRHSVREASGSGVGGRSAGEDVGRSISTDSEARRADLRSVVSAAAKRAQEAIRVLEEAAKARGGDHIVLERARYEAYDLELAVLERLTPIAPQWRVCVLITASICRGSWESVAEAAIAGGADCLQLREKTLDGRALLERARRLVALCRAGGAASVINDRADIAALAGADGVHVGQTDVAPADVRRIAGHGILVGVSTADLDQATAAVSAGASVCGVGPMFASTTKAKPGLAGVDYLRAYLASERLRRVPHLAISGIDARRARDLAGVGCRGVAVSSAVCGAEDPEGATRAIRAALAPAASPEAGNSTGADASGGG